MKRRDRVMDSDSKKGDIKEFSMKSKQDSDSTIRLSFNIPFSLMSEMKHWCIDNRRKFYEVVIDSLKEGWKVYKQKSR
jgi:hypothetical protein